MGKVFFNGRSLLSPLPVSVSAVPVSAHLSAQVTADSGQLLTRQCCCTPVYSGVQRCCTPLYTADHPTLLAALSLSYSWLWWLVVQIIVPLENTDGYRRTDTDGTKK